MSLREWLKRLERQIPDRQIDENLLARQLAAMDASMGGGPDLTDSEVLSVYGGRPDVATVRARLAELEETRAAQEPQPETEAGDARGKE